MTENKKGHFIFFVCLDFKFEGQAQLVKATVDLDDGSSTGTNNK